MACDTKYVPESPGPNVAQHKHPGRENKAHMRNVMTEWRGRIVVGAYVDVPASPNPPDPTSPNSAHKTVNENPRPKLPTPHGCRAYMARRAACSMRPISHAVHLHALWQRGQGNPTCCPACINRNTEPHAHDQHKQSAEAVDTRDLRAQLPRPIPEVPVTQRRAVVCRNVSPPILPQTRH